MYTDLKSYQNAVVIHDFTVEFCRRYVDGDGTDPNKTYASYKTYSRQADQMIQAARSGKQNIPEGTSNSKQKPKSEPFLLGVASASLKELLEDYKDCIRQHNLKLWAKDDPRAIVVRQLAYRDDKSYTSYKTYMENREDAANAMICLISQTTYLLDNQIKAIEKQMAERGITLETHEQKLRRIMREERERTRELDELAKKAANDAIAKMYGRKS